VFQIFLQPLPGQGHFGKFQWNDMSLEDHQLE